MSLQKSFLLIVLIVALSLRVFIVFVHAQNPSFRFQQDNYADYASALKNKTLTTSFPKEDRRLFPGLPILIFLLLPLFQNAVVAGVLVSLTSSLLAIFFFWKILHDPLATLLFAFFTPVWVTQSTKVATEPLLVFLLLISLYFYQKNKFFLTGICIGLACDVRIIACCLLLALLLQKGKKEMLLIGFFLAGSLLFIYNYAMFGSAHIFAQFTLYPAYGRATFGFIQIFNDITRAIDWRQYRILLSGLLYISGTLFAGFQLYRVRRKSKIYVILFYWLLFSTIFIFLLSPTPLLEEYGRFTVSFTPAIIVGLSVYIKKQSS